MLELFQVKEMSNMKLAVSAGHEMILKRRKNVNVVMEAVPILLLTKLEAINKIKTHSPIFKHRYALSNDDLSQLNFDQSP